jgi:hypothetical protein
LGRRTEVRTISGEYAAAIFICDGVLALRDSWAVEVEMQQPTAAARRPGLQRR